MAFLICFTGIYAVGDHEKKLPDGLSAVEDSIAELNVYSGMEKRSMDVYSDVYNVFTSQIFNCGGHLL
ncbi:MAG: hypothetical protein PUC06_06960, partial [Oscillospiraceae bacterium]|nr:hypothetical protein [Oscillospiraceae bacterium]